MKCRVLLAVVVSLLLTASFAWAQGKIPSLTGKWDVESTGGMMQTGQGESKVTHWTPGQAVLKGQLEIVSQDGRFIKGAYTSARGTENFIAMISPDGKMLYASDLDGFFDCKLVGKDRMEIVYRHVKPTDSVVATSVATRRK
uniref:TIGR03067 domain-containing protein n=1 Tax=Fundidesulfovibrio putealis TaxID=270496 RepID=A0A7C4EKD1_9BACT